MSDRKCRESIIFGTTAIRAGKVIREKASIRCDLVAGHNGQHWLALMTPFKKGQKANRIGYLFWDIS